MSDSYPDLSVEYQNIPIYQYVRKRIDNFKVTEILQNPKDEKEREYKTVLKIIYLFGGESAEIIGSSTNTDIGRALRGSVTTVSPAPVNAVTTLL